MSDFDDITYVEVEDKPSGAPVAPSGEYPSKIISAEKYKSAAGNWTLKVIFQIAGGSYRDHNEWYSLWSVNEDAKRVSTENFTKLSRAVGFDKKPPSSAKEYIGKELMLTVKEVENNWTDNDGNERTGTKNKIIAVNPFGGMSPPPAAVPPDLG
jgi:hypothetical protein